MGRSESHSDQWTLFFESEFAREFHCFVVVVGDIPNDTARFREKGRNQPPTTVSRIRHDRSEIVGMLARAPHPVAFACHDVANGIDRESLEKLASVSSESHPIEIPDPNFFKPRFGRLDPTAFGRVAAPTMKSPLFDKPQLLVNLHACGSCVEFGAFDPELQIFYAGLDKFRRDPLSSELRIDEHHTDPTDMISVSSRCRGSCGFAIEFANKATLRFESQKPFPIGEGLVPPRDFAKSMRKHDVSGEESSNRETSHKTWLSSLDRQRYTHHPRMSYQLESIELSVRELPPDRLSFSIGKADSKGKANAASKRRPDAILMVRATIESGGERKVHGYSGDRPSFGWLDKRPDVESSEKLTLLLDLVEASRGIYLKLGSEFDSPFALWQGAYREVAEAAKLRHCEDLMASYASALMERAVIDAVCRAEGMPFHELVRKGGLGIEPGSVHAELAGIAFAKIFPREPHTSFFIRHTVGLSDPIVGEDWPEEKRVRDGEPETLKEYAERDGLRYFKIKISGDADRDLDRLGRIWSSVLVERDRPVVTLDGNEAYTDIGKFANFVDRFESEHPGLFQHTLFIEQPLTRALTLDPSTAETVRRIAAKKPLVIDEADGTTDAFRKAFEIGYSGCSHKNCKGVFKSLLNYALIHHLSEETERELFLSGEDLSNMPIVPLHQDFAALGVLGVEHCERNGHHYAFGLSHLREGEKERIARAHTDLYVERGGEYFLRVEEGRVETRSVHSSAFGTNTRPDWDSLTPLDDWREENDA